MDLSSVEYVKALLKSILKFKMLCQQNENLSPMEMCQISK